MALDWWNDMLEWFASEDGRAVLFGAVIPFVAIVVAGVVAALIARGTVKGLLARQADEQRGAAVTAILSGARRAARWHTLSGIEKDHLEQRLAEADVRLRLLPVKGSDLAADWSAHHIDELKRNSATYTARVESDLADLQDGLIEWQDKPSRARKMFGDDLAAWKYEASAAEDDLIRRQREWNARQDTATTQPAGSTSGRPQGSSAATQDRPGVQSSAAGPQNTARGAQASGSSPAPATDTRRADSAQPAGTQAQPADTEATPAASAPSHENPTVALPTQRDDASRG